MKNKRIALSLVLCSGLIAACGQSWPPDKSEYVSNFYLYRSAIEKLESEFVQTDFEQIYVVVPGEVHAEKRGDISFSIPFLEGRESTKWEKLLGDARIQSIYNSDGITLFGIGWSMGIGDSVSVGYVHAPGQSQETNECKEEYAKISCGSCGIHLDEYWWVHFEWTNYFSDDQVEEFLSEGPENDDEDFAMQRAAEKDCKAEGRRTLGYPPEEP